MAGRPKEPDGNAPDLDSRLRFARETCRRAGEITLRYFNRNPETEWKADRSPVTVADRETERWIRARLEVAYPADGILGEELGADRPEAAAQWTIDPIDGTRSFISGVPLYAVLLGLLLDGRPVLGVAHFPALDETLSAATGLGCRWNDARAQVSDRASIAGARVLATSITKVEERLGRERWLGIRDRAEMVRTWGDAYGHALVATGRAEVMFDVGLRRWDAVPLVPILVEAGGSFLAWRGDVTPLEGDAIATNRRVDESLREAMREPSS